MRNVTVRRALSLSCLVLVLAIAAAPARADFWIASSNAVEAAPAAAYDPVTGYFLVVYLEDSGIAYQKELRGRLVDAAGNAVSGDLFLMGSGVTDGIGRPEVVYDVSAGAFLVAVTDRAGSEDRVLARYIDHDGQPVPQTIMTLFEDGSRALRSDRGDIRAAYNSLLGEVLVTFEEIYGGTGSSRIVAQRVNRGVGLVGPTVVLTDGPWFRGHGVAYAPVAGTTPYGGRYLFSFGADFLVTRLLDSAGNAILVSGEEIDGIPRWADIPLNFGEPYGNSTFPDIAYGVVQGQGRFLLVYADDDNCTPRIPHCPAPPVPLQQQASGVWGTYVDPERLWYVAERKENSPFQVSWIWLHAKNRTLPVPRVDYDADAHAFYVVWREVPVLDPANDESRSHVRGNIVDTFVPDGVFGTALTPLPHANVVLSDVSGTCPSAPEYCYSSEDPQLPAVAAGPRFRALTVWQQKWPANPADLDIRGDLFGLPVPANDAWTAPQALPAAGGDIDCTLVGATSDGAATCGTTTDAPDIWYAYTAPAAGTLRVTTCGTNDIDGVDTGTDTVVSLHAPATAAQLDPAACNDDWPGGNLPTACSTTDAGAQRDSALEWPLLAAQQVLVRVARYYSASGGRCLLHAGFSYSGAGRVPQDGGAAGVPLTLQRSGSSLALTWGASCIPSDTDFSIYEGRLGQWYSHQSKLCSTHGRTSATITPTAGDRYFLVTANNKQHEGSYGLDGAAHEIPPAAQACHPQLLAPCP